MKMKATTTAVAPSVALWLLPVLAAADSGSAVCVRITTLQGGPFHPQGSVAVLADTGAGLEPVVSGNFNQGETVLERCYGTLVGLAVSGPNVHGWVGNVLAIGGRPWSPTGMSASHHDLNQ